MPVYSLYSFHRTFIPAFEYLTPSSALMPVYALFTKLLSVIAVIKKLLEWLCNTVATSIIQPHDLLKIRNITPTTNLPHPGNSRLNGNPCSVMQLILLQLIRQNRSGTHQTHGPSLCQLRNNFFQKFLIKHSIINLPSK